MLILRTNWRLMCSQQDCFIATNSLLRGRISQTIDNRDSIEGYKKYNENEVLHTLLVAVLTIDAIVRFKERYDYTARVEFNATKQGEFTERGILSLANGPSDYMQKEFMREIEKSKTSGAQTSSKAELNKAMALLFQLSKDPSFSIDHKAYLELKQRLSDTPGLQLTPSEKDLMARMEKNVKQLDMCIEKMNGDDLKILNNEKIHDPRFPSDPSAQISAGLLIRHLKSLESLSVDMPSYWENVPSRPSSTAEEPRRPFPAVKMGARKQKRIAAMNEVSFGSWCYQDDPGGNKPFDKRFVIRFGLNCRAYPRDGCQ